MKIRVVTSFGKEGFAKYGRRFMESFKEHWPDDVDLWLYSEADTAPYPRYDLYADPDLIAFLAEAKRRSACFVDDYRKDAGRFAHKVFALTHERNFEDCDWLIWLDADTETVSSVTHEWLQTILPDDASVVYLGRKDMPHSECGFMAFNMNRWARVFLRDLRGVYASGEIWNCDEWHDSWLFDNLRDWHSDGADDVTKLRFHNLSEGIPGMHVWDDCPLGEKLKHHKGPLRQKGLKPGEGNVPDDYWSQKELREAGIKPQGKSNLKIKTQNCVPDEEIQENIRYNVQHIPNWVAECKVHGGLAVMCSGGPSLEGYLEQIRAKQEAGAKVVCVKHSHDLLIQSGIIPWACFLLDPRSHVKEFIENPHPDVIYFVASMCHPSTIDRLNERGATVYGYHAHVGAGEKEVLEEMKVSSFLIGGGSTSATRGVSVLNVLGFRRYHLYGYDSCYFDREPTKEKAKNGLPKWFEVEVGNRRFVTDAELLAQCQDFDKLLDLGRDVFAEIEVYGNGMIPHIFAMKRRILPELEEVIGRVSTPRAA